jgi:glycosyltransferase involved in cell wall biosynthesis
VIFSRKILDIHVTKSAIFWRVNKIFSKTTRIAYKQGFLYPYLIRNPCRFVFMEHPLISIVTPAFQQLEFLKACVASVAMQSYPYVEHLVLDGGSTDGTKAYLETSPGCVTWWRSHPDGGQTQALNEGFSKASGEWIGWQNSDDFYYPGAFWRIANIVTAFPEAEVIVGDTAIVDQYGITQYLIGVSPVPARLWLRGYWPYNQAVFIRRELLLKILPIDESLHIHMDTDLLAKIALLEPQIAYINCPFGAFRKYVGTKTENPDALVRSQHERDLLRSISISTGVWIPYATLPGSSWSSNETITTLSCSYLHGL